MIWATNQKRDRCLPVCGGRRSPGAFEDGLGKMGAGGERYGPIRQRESGPSATSFLREEITLQGDAEKKKQKEILWNYQRTSASNQRTVARKLKA